MLTRVSAVRTRTGPICLSHVPPDRASVAYQACDSQSGRKGLLSTGRKGIRMGVRGTARMDTDICDDILVGWPWITYVLSRNGSNAVGSDVTGTAELSGAARAAVVTMPAIAIRTSNPHSTFTLCVMVHFSFI